MIIDKLSKPISRDLSRLGCYCVFYLDIKYVIGILYVGVWGWKMKKFATQAGKWALNFYIQ